MKLLIFDAGPVISLTTNNLLWLLNPLKQRFKGDFCITEAVKKELVDRPIQTKKFKFEAIQVQQQIESRIIKVMRQNEFFVGGSKLQALANSLYRTNVGNVPIVQRGEMESLAATIFLGADAFVTDERITRMIIEAPDALREILEKRLHSKITINDEALNQFEEETRHVNVIRSVELVTVAYEQGLLDKFIVSLPNARNELLESVLWGVKLNGCAVGENEIRQILDIERKRRL